MLFLFVFRRAPLPLSHLEANVHSVAELLYQSSTCRELHTLFYMDLHDWYYTCQVVNYIRLCSLVSVPNQEFSLKKFFVYAR